MSGCEEPCRFLDIFKIKASRLLVLLENFSEQFQDAFASLYRQRACLVKPDLWVIICQMIS